MYRLVLVAVFLAAALPALTASAATQPSQHVFVTEGSSFIASGSWWRTLNHSQKILAVKSMMASEAYMFVTTTSLVVGDLMSSNKGDAIKSIRERDVSFSGEPELYVNKIDRYYAKHPDSITEVPIVLACFANAPFPKEGCNP